MNPDPVTLELEKPDSSHEVSGLQKPVMTTRPHCSLYQSAFTPETATSSLQRLASAWM